MVLSMNRLSNLFSTRSYIDRIDFMRSSWSYLSSLERNFLTEKNADMRWYSHRGGTNRYEIVFLKFPIFCVRTAMYSSFIASIFLGLIMKVNLLRNFVEGIKEFKINNNSGDPYQTLEVHNKYLQVLFLFS